LTATTALPVEEPGNPDGQQWRCLSLPPLPPADLTVSTIINIPNHVIAALSPRVGEALIEEPAHVRMPQPVPGRVPVSSSVAVLVVPWDHASSSSSKQSRRSCTTAHLFFHLSSYTNSCTLICWTVNPSTLVAHVMSNASTCNDPRQLLTGVVLGPLKDTGASCC
jgi:hypothetical protein